MAKKKYRVAGGCALCMAWICQGPRKETSLIGEVAAVIDETKCIGCGSCYDACQPGAIQPYEVEEK